MYKAITADVPKGIYTAHMEGSSEVKNGYSLEGDENKDGVVVLFQEGYGVQMFTSSEYLLTTRIGRGK